MLLRSNFSSFPQHFPYISFPQYSPFISNFKSHITYSSVKCGFVFSSILLIWYVEVWVSQCISESPLDLQIMSQLYLDITNNTRTCTLSCSPRVNSTDNRLTIFCYFSKPQTLQVNCLQWGDNLHEMSNFIFWENQEKYFNIRSAEIFTNYFLNRILHFCPSLKQKDFTVQIIRKITIFCHYVF